MHVPFTLSVSDFGVNAQTTELVPSIPPPLQAVATLYDEQAALAIQVAPFDTHSLPLMTPEQLELFFPSAISSHYLGLQALVPVVAPTGKANAQSPSVPVKQPAST